MAKGIFQIMYDVALAISGGLVKNVKHFGKFGFNENLVNGVEALVWPGPTAVYVFPDDAGESMRLVSANAADTQTMMIQALDQDWNEVNIPLALDGTTPVTIPGNLARINRVINISGTDTLGDVSVTNAAGSVTYAFILKEEGITTQLVFSIPARYNAKLEDSFITINKSGGATVSVIFRYRRRPFGGSFGTGARFGLNRTGTSAVNLNVKNVAPLSAKSDIMFLALADANNTDVSARLPFTLYKV